MVDDIESFENFASFFTRKIKPRPVDSNPDSLVSPADSIVLCYSEITKDECMIIKGIDYKLGELITGVEKYKIDPEILKTMIKNPNNKLYQCVLYLAPGDYHRYHSPAEFYVKSRNHILGYLAPVKESHVKTRTDIYERNERVSVFGLWNKGFMNMTFVGALNVGSIDLIFDPDLKTNESLSVPFDETKIKFYTNPNPEASKDPKMAGGQIPNSEKNGILIKKGEEMGKFNLGSTIVMVFEASPDFDWKIKAGQAVKYGEVIGVTT